MLKLIYIYIKKIISKIITGLSVSHLKLLKIIIDDYITKSNN